MTVRPMAKTTKTGKHKEREISVSLSPSVARDLITVLQKFSQNQMERLLHGDKKRADRLMALNLFRADVEQKINGN